MTSSTHTVAYEVLRETLKAIRNKAGLSQRALAEKIGVPHTWVSKVETGERRIDAIEFIWFCFVLNEDPLKFIEKLIPLAIEKPNTSSNQADCPPKKRLRGKKK